MKRKSLLGLLLCAFAVMSCSKENTPPPTYQIAGLWIGTYTVNQIPSQGNLYYSFIIKPDGTLLTEGKGGNGTMLYSSGTWSLTDSTFTYKVQAFQSGIQQTGALKFSNKGQLTGGTWTDTNNSPNLSGTFPVMARIN
ncbi:MAG: hypothetical protein QM726_01075 [Chitinophagaceae bacterium]